MSRTKLIVLTALAVLLAGAGGYFVGHHANRKAAGAPSLESVSPAKSKPLYWVSPMNPNYRSDRAGKSPMGMDLVPVYAHAQGAAPADVEISSAVVNELGVRTAEVELGTLAHSIRAVGYVGYDESSLNVITTRADGWIEKLAVSSVGDQVRRGQLLYELFSPKLATSEREYLVALKSGDRGLIAASAERLRSLGFTPAQVQGLSHTHVVHDRVARRAEQAGVVVNLGVREGQYVMPATPVMKLADLRTVWILAEVDESRAALLASGEKAVARVDAFPGRLWQGAVDYVYPNLDPTTRSVRVRLRFANPGVKLLPNMFAHVHIEAAPQRRVLYIPQLALIQTGHSERVVVALGHGRFDVCPIETGFESGDRVQVLKGLRAGERVVVSAQFMLDSEANVNAAALRLDSNKPGCASAVSQQHPASRP